MLAVFRTCYVQFKMWVMIFFFCFRGIPALVDFAAMRDAVMKLGGDPYQVNPLCPTDLIVDHSLQIDFSKW